ncbi:MAG: hypothetical protein IJP69_04275, partial [Synergistaceae bacterium]|nr:hypothetical protein [Synergistaceae bacterium]
HITPKNAIKNIKKSQKIELFFAISKILAEYIVFRQFFFDCIVEKIGKVLLYYQILLAKELFPL